MPEGRDSLVEMPLDDILNGWRPGSHDWDWAAERHDLLTRDTKRTEDLRQSILKKGFGLADDTAPIKLGNDGRVWNGHHRLILAMEYRPNTLMVVLVPKSEKETGDTDA